MTTTDDVLRNVAETLLISPEALHERSAAVDFEEWDSMGTMALMSMLDGRYGLRLAPGDAAQLQSVSGILDLLRKAGKL